MSKLRTPQQAPVAAIHRFLPAALSARQRTSEQTDRCRWKKIDLALANGIKLIAARQPITASTAAAAVAADSQSCETAANAVALDADDSIVPND